MQIVLDVPKRSQVRIPAGTDINDPVAAKYRVTNANVNVFTFAFATLYAKFQQKISMESIGKISEFQNVLHEKWLKSQMEHKILLSLELFPVKNCELTVARLELHSTRSEDDRVVTQNLLLYTR